PFDQIGFFVDVEPDPVSRPVDEVVAIAGVFDDTPGGAVDLLARNPCPHRVYSGLLRDRNHLMYLGLLRCRLTHRERSRRVRSVPPDRAAEVTNHQVTWLDHTARRIMMGRSSVRPRGHDRE